VFGNNRVGGGHDVFCGPVVLFQLHHEKIRIILFKVQDVLDVCAPESIDALGIIPNHTNDLMDCSQFFGDNVLGKVGILKLIHHDIFELLLVLVEDIRMISEQHVGIEQQVVKVHSGGFK